MFSPPREWNPFSWEARVPLPCPGNDLGWYGITVGSGHEHSQLVQKFDPVLAETTNHLHQSLLMAKPEATVPEMP